MFGINGAELVVILLIAAVVVGPERLPGYAEQLARWVRALRSTVATSRERLSAELGEDDIDWAALDPRKYDPRRIVREALATPDGAPGFAAGPVVAGGSGVAGRSARPRAVPAGPVTGPAPFDDEAT